MWGKVGVSVSGADGNRVYAIIESRHGGVFVSDDAGATWTQVSEDRNLRQRAFYYTRIVRRPEGQGDRVRAERAVLALARWRQDVADDRRAARRQPRPLDRSDNNQRMINSNDGGANVSVERRRTWTGQAYPTAQMYDVRVTEPLPVPHLRRPAGQQHGLRADGRRRQLHVRARRLRDRPRHAAPRRREPLLRRLLRRLDELHEPDHRPEPCDQRLAREPDGQLGGGPA
jgi:hypothetical protein